MIWEWAIKDKINEIFIYLEQKISLELIAKNVKKTFKFVSPFTTHFQCLKY